MMHGMLSTDDFMIYFAFYKPKWQQGVIRTVDCSVECSLRSTHLYIYIYVVFEDVSN